MPSRSRFLALFILLFCAPVTEHLCATDVVRGVDDINGRQARDPGSNDKTVIDVWAGDTVSTTFDRVKPGVHTLRVNGRFLGKLNVRYSLQCQVKQGRKVLATTTVWSHKLKADGGYHDIVIPMAVLENGTVQFECTLRDGARQEDAELIEKQDKAEFTKKQIASERGNEATGVEEGDDDEDMELEDVLPLPKGKYSFLMTSVSLKREPATLAVTRLWPDKIHYKPGDTATLDVEVSGFSSKASQGILVVDLIRGIDRKKELFRKPISATSKKAFSHKLTVPCDESYGYELRASVLDAGGKTMHVKREYFSVSKNVFEMSIYGWGRVGVSNGQGHLRQFRDMPQKDLDALSHKSALSNRRKYVNLVEFFSWARDDYFDLSPEEDAWWSGTMTYIKVKRNILAEIHGLQRQGIKVLTYAQPYAIGLETPRVLRTNPEYFSYHGNGAPAVGYNYDLMKSRARLDMGLRPQEIGGGLNMFNVKTIDRGIQEVIDSWKMFGWDGVRYDNRYYRANNPVTYEGKRAAPPGTNLDEYSQRNVKRQKERFWSEIHKDWLISHNNGYRFNTPDNTLGWQETVKDGLMCMDEETEGASSPSSNLNPWKNYFAFATEARRACTKLGGYYQLFPPERGNAQQTDAAHYTIACAASGSHPITVDTEHTAAGHYARFFTRYGSLYWANDILPIDDDSTYLTIDGANAGKLWWKGFSNQRTVGNTKWQMFSLVVPPHHERVMTNPACFMPDARENVKVLFDASKLPANAEIFALSPELPDMQKKLKTDSAGGKIVITVPRIELYMMLVVRGGAK